MQDALPEQGKAGPSVHGAFDELEFGDASFDHAVIDGPGEAIAHSVFVFLNPGGKGLEFGKSTPLHLLKPGIQTLSGAGAHHLDEVLNQISGLVDFWMELKELAKRLLLLDVEFFRATQQKESRLPRGGEGRYLC